MLNTSVFLGYIPNFNISAYLPILTKRLLSIALPLKELCKAYAIALALLKKRLRMQTRGKRSLWQCL
ncbi:hypothetical protein, partial [Nostoc sp.]